ncbi:MAG: hypothetical protein ABI199_04975 [Bacteroidia bacterium]
MKKTLSFFLLVLFLFNVGGFYVAYVVLHKQNQKTFFSLVQKNNFSKFKTLRISNEEMENTSVFQKKNSDEFRYKGKMYDIVRQHKTKNETVFYCYEDENDSSLSTALTNQINNFVHSNDTNNTQKNNFLNSFFNKLYCTHSRILNTFFPGKIGFEKIFFQAEYNSPHGKVPVPPPKYILV